MNTQASFLTRAHNPDVLSCIANLSNDEVFTPPSLVNQMLDELAVAWSDSHDGEVIWSNPSVTFLDPCTKSGVFLREIVKRLADGQEDQEQDLAERVDRILRTQVFGMGITNLTALLARRSVYCSKFADGDHSIFKSATSADGNVWFKRTEHDWGPLRCLSCGASRKEFERDEGLESHAYRFIHGDGSPQGIAELFGGDVEFDVVIGNPPYQLNDGGGIGSSAASPIYQHFIDQAVNLDPRMVLMVVPSRWMVGGRGLDEFRGRMLADRRLAVIHDYPDASEVFPGVEIKGGVSYFLWSRSHDDDCVIHTHDGARSVVAKRPLLEEGLDIFLRHSEQVALLKKILISAESQGLGRFDSILSANDTFGFDVREEGSFKRVRPDFKKKPFKGSVQFYYNGWRAGGLGHIDRKQIRKNSELVDVPKILLPKAWGAGRPEADRLKAFAVDRNTCCTETYIVGHGFQSLREAENAISFTKTKFFHFMVSFVKPTQNASVRAYQLVPLVDFTKGWRDEDLYQLFNLSKDDVGLIDGLVWTAETDDRES